MNTLIFVHGTLRKGQGLNPVLERGGAKYITTTHLVYPNTILVALSKQSYPAVVQVGSRWTRGIAMPVGEVYEVSSELLSRLDAIEGVPSFYERYEAHVNLDPPMSKYLAEHGKRVNNTVKVLYYGMHMEHRCLDNGTIIENGDWCDPTWGLPFRQWVAAREEEEATVADMDALHIGLRPTPERLIRRPLGEGRGWHADEPVEEEEEEWHDEDDDTGRDENGDPI